MEQLKAKPNDSLPQEIKKKELELNEQKIELEKEIQKLEGTIKELKNELTLTDESIERKVKDANERINSHKRSSDKFRNSMRYVLLITWFGTLAVFVGWYLLSKGLSYDAVLIQGISALGILALLFFAIVKRFPSELTSGNLAIDFDNKRVETLSAVTSSISQDIQSVMRKIIPQLDIIMELVEKKHAQRVLSKTMRNALSSFNIEINSQADLTLESFSSKYSGEEEWLSVITKNLSENLGISQPIIALSYYEYGGDQKGVRNTWIALKNNPNFLTELASHFLNFRYKSYLKDQTSDTLREPIKSLLLSMGDQFSLRDFDIRFYTFYVDFSETKVSMLEALHLFKFNVSIVLEREVLNHFPDSAEISGWRQELIKFVAERINEYPELIELLFTTKTGDHIRRKQVWEIIVGSDSMIQHCADFLLENEMIEVPDLFRRSETIRTMLIGIMRESSDFSVNRLGKSLLSGIDRISSIKQVIFRAAAQFRLTMNENDREIFYVTLPIADVEESLLRDAAKAYGIEEEIFKLFYHSYQSNRVKEGDQLDKIIGSGKASVLAKMLVERGLVDISVGIEKEEAISNLAVIITNRKDFNLQSLQADFSSLTHLLVHSERLFTYLDKHEFEPQVKLTMDGLLSLLPKTNHNQYNQLKIICKKLIKDSKYRSTTEDFLNSIVLSVLSLYLTESHDAHNANNACREAAIDGSSRQILYQFVFEQETNRSKTFVQVRLSDIIQKVIESESLDFKHLEPFQAELANGRIPLSISGLLTSRFDYFEKQVAEKRDLLERMLSDMKDDVNKFFNIQLDPDVVTQSLDSGLVSAYMVTAAGRGPLMEVFNNMEQAANQLAQSDPVYNGLLMSERGPVAGKNTRVGIIPFGMRFEQFHTLFDNILNLAVSMKIGDSADKKEYAYNLVKINASESAFRHRIPGSADVDVKSENYPINIIKNLMIEYLSPVKNLEIIASVKSGVSRTIAMRNAVTGMLDGYTNLLNLTNNKIGRIVGGRKTLLEKMESREFDQSLFRLHNCKTLTEFAKQMRDSIHATTKDQMIANISKYVSSIVKSYGVRLDSEELTTLSGAILDEAERLGTIIGI